MTKLEQLIEQLCPYGVEYKKVGEAVKYEQPSKYLVKSTAYNDDYSTPVLTAGQTFVLGYTNETDGIYPASVDDPVIIFDDFTGAFKWVDFPFKAKSSAMKMLKAKEDIASLRFIFYIMSNIGLTSDEHKRLWIGIYSELRIPVPPLEVQEEIVRILDDFTVQVAELTENLLEEQRARKKQFEYYRDELLSFDIDVKTIPLGDISISISSGKNKTRLDSGLYPVYGSTGIIAKTDTPGYFKEQILVARVGANAGFVHIATGEYDVSDNTLIIDVKKDYVLKYIYYLLVNKNLNQYAKGGGQPLVTAGQLKEIVLSIPSYDTQKRIVEVLDNFEAICSDLNIGLPAEIEARQKQYEYYRNLLLTFAETGGKLPEKRREEKRREEKRREEKRRELK